MRHYFLKPIRPRQTVVTPVLTVSPASVNLDRTSPGNVATFTASLNLDPGSAVAVTVSSSDPSVTVSPSTFSLGGGNPVTQTVTATGATAGPDSVTLSVSAPGQTTKSIAITRPAVPLDLTVTPASLLLDRVSPGNAGSFDVALNRVPDSAVLVSISSSDASVTVFPASFSLSTGNPPSRSVSLTGATLGPSPVTISVNPLGLAAKSVTVTRPPFTPNTLSGLSLWLDASDASSITLDGSNNVSQWDDKSGNGWHFSQSNASNRPSITTTFLTNKTAMLFSGSSKALLSSTTWNDLGDNAVPSITEFYVVRWPSGVGLNFVGESTAAGHKLFAYFTDGRSYYDGGTQAGARVSGNVGTEVLTGLIVTGQRNAGNVSLWHGTTLSASRTNATGDLYAGISNTIRFTAPSSSDSALAEVLIYRGALTTNEIASVWSYLKAKWGTP